MSVGRESGQTGIAKPASRRPAAAGRSTNGRTARKRTRAGKRTRTKRTAAKSRATKRSSTKRSSTKRTLARRSAWKSATQRSASPRRWSARVTQTSDALDLESDVFKQTPAAIARSLKRSAERSKRRKSSPYRAAMSMITFYENRAGKNLSAQQRTNIEKAKDALRKLFGR